MPQRTVMRDIMASPYSVAPAACRCARQAVNRASASVQIEETAYGIADREDVPDNAGAADDPSLGPTQPTPQPIVAADGKAVFREGCDGGVCWTEGRDEN